MNPILEYVKKSGFPYCKHLIHLYIGGSALHGAKQEGYDDLDIYGVYIEPPHEIIGVDKFEHFVWSTGSQETKNTANDIDITLYGLQKWAGLAAKGNPSILHSLFADNILGLGTRRHGQAAMWCVGIRGERQAFLCKKHYKAFFGFAQAQLQRMVGERSMNVHRPDLVEKYGYDTKYAMHIIRLLVECEELMKTGRITLPSKEKDLLVAIRNGQKTQEWVIQDAYRRFDLCKAAEASSPLPEALDRHRISNIISETYRMHWHNVDAHRYES